MRYKYISPTMRIYNLSARQKLLAGSDIMFRDSSDYVDDPDEII